MTRYAVDASAWVVQRRLYIMDHTRIRQLMSPSIPMYALFLDVHSEPGRVLVHAHDVHAWALVEETIFINGTDRTYTKVVPMDVTDDGILTELTLCKEDPDFLGVVLKADYDDLSKPTRAEWRKEAEKQHKRSLQAHAQRKEAMSARKD